MNLLRFASCLFVAFLFQGVFAQQTSLDLRPETGDQVFTLSDENGVSVVWLTPSGARLWLLDDNLEVQQVFDIPDVPPASERLLLGFTRTRDSLLLVFELGDGATFEVVSVGRDEGGTAVQNLSIGRTGGTPVHWGTFTHEGVLHVLRLPRGGGSIRLCRFGGNDFSTLEFSVDYPGFLEKTGFELTRIEAGQPVRLDASYRPGKLYYQGQQVHLTLDDGAAGLTHLVSIDLQTGEKQERSFPGPVQGRAGAYKVNSLLLGDHLFQAAANADSLLLHISPRTGGAPLSRYAYGRGDEMELFYGLPERTNPEGQTESLFSPAEWLDLVANAPYLALGADSLDRDHLAVYLGGVQPTRTRGASGMVLNERSHVASVKAILSPQTLLPVANPQPALASQRRPTQPQAIRPYQTHVQHHGLPVLGYFDPAAGGYVLRVE